MGDTDDETSDRGGPGGEQAAILAEVLTILEPLVVWLVRSGVGYGVLASALKPVVLAQAERELSRLGRKQTDSALSLLSGLHRKDVRLLGSSAARITADNASQGASWGKPSAANQVATRWLSLDWPDTIPVNGEEPSFEALARRVSRDFHHRAVLDDLIRLGIVREAGGRVELLRHAFTPAPGLSEARQLFAGSATDHLSAGVHNLTTASPGRFLEQSVFADGLSEASVRELHGLANEIWADALRRVVDAAVPLCERDQGQPVAQRFRLGVFSFSAPEESGQEKKS
ncbi:MAG: DUF6502 family protein [Betaproteobacteria bacterium]